MAAIKSLVASGSAVGTAPLLGTASICVLLALLLAPAVLADAYPVKPNPADQRWAIQTMLTPRDFGLGWHGGVTPSEKPVGISCPGFDPKASDLVVTGYASADLQNASADLTVSQDLFVLADAGAVQKDFARTMQPPLAPCLEYQLRRAPHVTAVTVQPLAFPKVGTDSAAYRATITLKFKTGTTKLIRDYVFFSNGRLELALTVDAPTRLRTRLVGFEAEMARMLVRRGART